MSIQGAVYTEAADWSGVECKGTAPEGKSRRWGLHWRVEVVIEETLDYHVGNQCLWSGAAEELSVGAQCQRLTLDFECL